MPHMDLPTWNQVRYARERNYLRDINADILRGVSSVIVLGCGDGYRDPEASEHLHRLLPNEQVPVVHSIKRNGGALILTPNSPVIKPGRTSAVDLIDDIADAHNKLGIMHLIIKAHVPCLKAVEAKMSLYDVFTALVAARNRIKEEFPEIQVIKIIDIDGGEFGPKRSYKLCGRALESVQPMERLALLFPDRVTIRTPARATA